ncbi:MAG: hypothetical protein HRU24_11015 [Gammaproteobacteria bacterium]|nr:hypothetical protein [Gammaproteobacteria bacterium]
MLLKTKITTLSSLLTLAIASQVYAATIQDANKLTNINNTMTRSGHSFFTINGETIDLRTAVEHTLPSGQKK